MVSVHTSSPPTVHTAYLRFLCDKCDCSTLDLDSWNSSWSISLVWKSTWEEKEDTVDCRSRKPSFLNAEYLSIITSHTHCVYTPPPPPPGALPSATWKKKKPPGTNFACVATSFPCFLPASKSEWRHHLAQTPKDDGGGKHHAFSQSVYVLRTLTWETCEQKEKTDGTARAFWKCLAFLGFKELADGRVHRLLGTSMKANIFLRQDVLPMHTTVLLGTRKFYPSAWRMASKKSAPWAHLTVENYYPGQKNWNSRAHVTQARDLSSMHAPMFGLRACFNVFGQGSMR